MHCEVKTIRERSPYVEKPALEIPNWHTSAGRNIYDRQALIKCQCKHIADTFREVLFKYNDCSATRLVIRHGNYWVPLDAETLGGWLSKFYYLDGIYEVEQVQRLHAWLVSDESTLQFAN
jgi:hypothetical protein